MNSTCELGDDAARALKPYPAYKDSRIAWLGEVPEHWQVRRLKTLCSRSALYGANVAATSYTTAGVRFLRTTDITEDGQLNGRGVFLPQESVDNYLLADGDVLISRSGTIGRSFLYERRIHGPCAYAGYLVRFVPAPIALPKYIFLFTKTHAFAGFLRVKAISSTIENVNGEKYANCPLPLPPHSEQAAIVRFLDHADRRIRRYIRAKQQLITLLAETREAATHDALRSAGSRSLRIGSAADRVERLISRRDDQVYTPIGLYNRGRGIFHKPATMGSDLGDSTFFWLAEGDLVLSGQFAWEGAVALAGEEDAGCVASHRYPVLRGKPDLVESAYLLSFFRTGWGQLLLDHHSRGAAGRNRPLNAASLMKERIPVPSLHVQKQIGTLVRREYRLRQALAEQATLLREYRTRLIADVVTGKFDVLEAAARLPDEVEELEPLDEADALIDSEEEPTDALATVP